ncbi:J domain-containing protein [Syntrophorhabdus aromaticivorans]|jgi:molecular chaperone DnaJ|uniref:J domain-containing protein n=1 Tax=Syntrophorhabdus aromaticivorans TaxID=328301 RepID=UPI00040D1A66|nr:J domain-containing protein [Syntrophorhabdus aromaticivorans]
MTKKDYYEVLGIGREAGADEIKKAYRGLVMKYHPDRNPDNPEAAEIMKDLNEAYAVLSNQKKRQLYDLYGHEGLSGYSEGDLFRDVDFSGLFREFGMRDIFGFGGSILGDLFGFGRERSGPQKGADLRYDLTIALEEAALGVEKTVRLPRREVCPVCRGTGAEPDGLQECDQCHGTGQIINERRSGSSVFREIRTCRKCGGKRSIVTKSCGECEGRGVIEKIKEISITVPPGADTGYAIKVEGEGEHGKDVPGDLYVVIDVAKHPVFERHGDDLYREQEISFTIAALGGVIETTDLESNRMNLEIPEGTQTGTVLKVEGKGMPHLGGEGTGDQYVVVRVTVPTNLNEKQKELLRQFQKIAQNEDSAC